MKTKITKEHIDTLRAIGEGLEERQAKSMTIEVNEEFPQVKIDGIEIELTKTEFKLFAFLWKNRNMTCTREMILNKVYEYSLDISSRAVDVYIGYIRNKLLAKKIDPSFIKTKAGFGYRIEI